MYKITNYTYKQAKKLHLQVKPSTNKTKKIDVYKIIKKNNKSVKKKIASVGAYGMNDYPTYIKNKGIKYAKTRRRLYKQRHEKDRHIKWSNGWLADKLLW
jgi:hypothetical protein